MIENTFLPETVSTIYKLFLYIFKSFACIFIVSRIVSLTLTRALRIAHFVSLYICLRIFINYKRRLS